jgi:hypothetical protein
MKLKFLIIPLLLNAATGLAQSNTTRRIAETEPPEVALAPLRYLASDELKGRGFDRPEINVAAQYISNEFKIIGVKTVPGATGYFQPFTLNILTPATTGQISIGDNSFKLGDDAIQQQPCDVNLHAPLIYAGHATVKELDTMGVKGKIIFLDLGASDNSSLNAVFADFMQIPAILTELDQKGALGLVECFNGNTTDWAKLKGYLMRAKLANPSQTSKLPAILLNRTAAVQGMRSKGFTAPCSIDISGTVIKEIKLKNVMGYIQGTDAKLRGQYILLTSHYDHLGVAKTPKMEEGKLDSIYNGARDNALGTASVIDAARYFAKYPPKRSVLFITYTAEEEGLIGSEWYSIHPLIALNKIVYNLNIDNASYNDTTLITFVGLGRTTADSSVIKACKAYGLHVNNDPTGGALFSGSDNYPLALKGVPAPTFSLGMKTFDATITNRYHQLSDEVGNMDLAYTMKFIKAYILAAQYIANDPLQPKWTKGDPLEKEWMALYQ